MDWTLSRVMKASVAFKVSGWKCLRDVTIKFEKVIHLLLCVTISDLIFTLLNACTLTSFVLG